ncbi:MAG TPA: alpha/beta fold hydrolase [Candidatus Acidoferrales bacterium]|nr:alpha/beta fold hydrolase [Candidatus Acidoferrales bacterium]
MDTTVYGTPSASGDNVVLVAHALTGTSAVAEWWPQVVGPGGLFDTRTWCVIGLAMGDERTLAGVVREQRRRLDELGIKHARLVIGGSLGGMQALQWALDAPERIDQAIVIGASDHHTAMGIALNHVQREAIALDPVHGLALARQIAMLTYKSDDLLAERHEREPDRNGQRRFDVEGYLDHQGRKLVARMDPHTYVARTHLMDSFDVRDRDAPPGVDITFVGISSDWLFRPREIRAAAKRLHARYLELDSTHGHDAFLAEGDKLHALLGAVVTPSVLSP